MPVETLIPTVAENMFTLFERRALTSFNTFVLRLNNYVDERVRLGDDRADVLARLDDDFNNRGPLYRQIGGDVGGDVAWGLNTTYQVSSNPAPAKRGTLFEWTLDPNAKHCESCLHQASLGPRSFDDIPLPGQQPTHGDTNCNEYCKCTLTPTRDAGGDAGTDDVSASPVRPTPAPSVPKAPRPPAVNAGYIPPAPKAVSIKRDDLSFTTQAFPNDYDADAGPAVIRGLEKSAGAFDVPIEDLTIGTKKEMRGMVGVARTSGGATSISIRADYMSDPLKMTTRSAQTFEANKNIQTLKYREMFDGAGDDNYLKAEVTESIQKIAETPRWSMSSLGDGTRALEITASHEGFHAVYRLRKLEPAWFNALRNSPAKMSDAHKVSEYAASSPSELFAEVGAAITNGIDIPNQFVLAFKQTMATIGY